MPDDEVATLTNHLVISTTKTQTSSVINRFEDESYTPQIGSKNECWQHNVTVHPVMPGITMPMKSVSHQTTITMAVMATSNLRKRHPEKFSLPVIIYYLTGGDLWAEQDGGCLREYLARSRSFMILHFFDQTW